jgi:hypothetical protein
MFLILVSSSSTLLHTFKRFVLICIMHIDGYTLRLCETLFTVHNIRYNVSVESYIICKLKLYIYITTNNLAYCCTIIIV